MCHHRDMFKLPVLRKSELSWKLISQWLVLSLLVVSVLWRGGKSLEMTWLLTGVTSVVVLISHWFDQKKSRVPVVLWVAVMLFIALTVLSYLLSSTANYGFDEVLRTGSFSLLLLWMLRSCDEPETGEEFITTLVRVLSITVFTACMIGLLVYVFQPVNRFVGTFFDARFHTDYWPNAWANFFLLTWPVVFYWVLRKYDFNRNSMASRTEFLVRALILGVVVGCFFLAFSRGATLALFFQVTCWGGVVAYKAKKEFPLRYVIPTAVMIAVFAYAMFGLANNLRSEWYDVLTVEEKVTMQAAEGTSSVTERLDFWGQSTALWLQKPWFGWGPYSFRFAQTSLQTSVLATSDHPHNVFLKLLAERGLLAVIVFVVPLCIVLYLAIRMILKEEEYGSLSFSLRLLTLIGLLGCLAHSMIDFNLQFVGIALPFWLLLGVTLSFLHAEKLSPISHSIARLTETFLVICLLCAAFYEGVFLVTSSYGRHALVANDVHAALVWFERSAPERFSRDLHLSRAQIYQQAEQYDEADAVLQDYFSVNAIDYRAWKKQGDIALLQGNPQQALTAFTEAYRRGKYNDLGITRGMIETYLALDQREELDAYKPQVDALMQEFAAAIVQNKHHIALSPNVEEFIVISNTLARLYPNEAPRYEVIAARVDRHAQQERERITARPPGFLW